MGDESYGLVDHWLAGIRDQVRRHQSELDAELNEQARFDRVVELNVLRQVYNLSRTPIVQNCWKRGRRPLLHGIVYDIRDGRLTPLVLEVDGSDKVRALLEADRRGVGV
jgi:carbonic anhydrase